MLHIFLLVFLQTIDVSAYNDDPRVRDAFEMIMQKYKYDSSTAIADAANNEYKSQFNDADPLSKNQIVPFDVILKQYQDYSDTTMQKASRVVYESLTELSQNVNEQFYVWNKSSKIWSLPNQPAPTSKVDGAAVNARTLSSKIQTSLQKQLYYDELGIKKRAWNPFVYFKNARPQKVLDPNDIKLGWRRGTFGKARMKTAAKLFFKPKIIQIYFSIGAIGYLYFICGNLFGPGLKNPLKVPNEGSTAHASVF